MVYPTCRAVLWQRQDTKADLGLQQTQRAAGRVPLPRGACLFLWVSGGGARYLQNRTRTCRERQGSRDPWALALPWPTAGPVVTVT